MLPFENVGSDPDTEYLSDGLTDSLINALSGLSDLRVVPRGIVFSYKGRTVDLQTVGRELDVRAVVTGRVTQRGETLVVGAELTDVTAVSQLWGDQYTRQLTDIFALQEAVTRDIVRHLRPQLTGAESKLRRALDLDPDSVEAHRVNGVRLSGEGRHKEAVSELRSALRPDPQSLFIRFWLATGLLTAGRTDEAVELDAGFPSSYAMLS